MELSRDEIDGTLSGISSVQELFLKQYAQTPDAIAVESGSNRISYAALAAQAGALSKLIQQASPDSKIVGISTSRSIDMIAAVLGILQAGKAYLPLDPSLPEDRLRQVIADSGIDCLACPASEGSLFETFGLRTLAHHAVSAGTNEVQKANSGALAYVLYTSGSTGKPKGVCMGHAALVNLLHWQRKRSAAGLATRTLQYAPLSFDVSFQEIFATLGTGGTLVLIEDDLRLDPTRLLEFIRDRSIERLFVPFVALQYLTEAAAAESIYPASLKEVITAGEQLKITAQVTAFFKVLPQCSLDNQYGPTECHVVTANKLTGDSKTWPALPSIGTAIDRVTIHLIGNDNQEVRDGDSGELCISGVCLAEGYLNRPELSAEKFVLWNDGVKAPIRIYRTGDLARREPDGNIEFLGRRDDQVKIRGYRIEPGEIEVLLSAQPGIRHAVVVAREDVPGQLRLVAYLVASGTAKDTAAIRQAVSTHLPDYMMPSAFVWMENLPKTSSGKVDRKTLPKPDNKRPELSVLYTAPSTPLEKILAAVWIPLLLYDRIGVNDNFFELGGNSLLAVKTVATLQLDHRLSLPVTKLYQHPTIAAIARLLEGKKTAATATTNKKQRRENENEEVAIIAMAGRFPGSVTINELWQMLQSGKETISFFSREELDPSVPASVADDPDYVRARGILQDPAAFDAAFFGINPKLAELMDPQQRIFLEIAWEALEQAGYLPAQYTGSVGVFAGVGNNSYYLNNVLSNRVLVERMGAFQVMTYNEKDYVASRTAYTLDLKGPAVSVHSACSTSLLAIAEAVESLRSGQCEIALAGGASVTAPIKSGHIYQEGAMLSKDGHCRSFDAQGDGTVFSDGAGVVLLKKRAAAERDGDRILALIKGVGVNNDGGGKGSFSAPSAEGQAGAIRMAFEDARIEPSTLTYIEAHGTATPLGDPIEIEGLRLAFGEQAQKQFCAIGSIKSNMGHLTAAAGVAGLIKTVLAMQHHQIPASLHYTKPNKDIDFTDSPFFVNSSLRDWSSDTSRRAGISSFGVGGTNVHVVLEEYAAPVSVSGSSRPVQLISWSAKTSAARDRYTTKLASFVKTDHPALADLAFTLQTSRTDFRSRRFVIAGSADELIEKLNATSIPATEAKTLEEGAGELVFVFPGQGAQFVNMGVALYQQEPVFRSAVDECAGMLIPLLGEDIRAVIYPADADAAATEKLNDTFYTQPSLFVIGYALARLWMSWGVQPSAFIGHSIGEFVAAHLAGVFSLEDGLKLIASRGRLMQSLPRGTMLSVRAPHTEVEPLLPEGISMAAVNSPALCVVAGETEKVRAFSQTLDARGIANKPLHTSHAFHSEMMDPVVKPFLELVKTIQLRVPRIPVVSTVTGEWLTDTNATDPAYWAQHLRSTVRFSQAAAFALTQSYKIFLEAGPGTVSGVLIRQQPLAKGIQPVASLDAAAGSTAYHSILRALGQLWLQGVAIDWKGYYGKEQRIKLGLPAYAFEKTRFWVDPVTWIAPADTEQTSTFNELKPKETIMRTDTLIAKIKEILENASGIEMDQVTPDMGFIEMGLDSLLLTQVTLNIKKEFGVPVTFRQLNEDYSTLEALAGYLDKQLPAGRYAASSASAFSAPVSNPVIHAQPAANGSAMSLISQQIQLLAQQVAMLQGGTPAVQVSPTTISKPPATAEGISAEELAELKKPFGATARIEKQITELSASQKAFLDDLTTRYNKKTAGSKAFTQQHRDYMADPRVVSGFKPLTKEIVYPIVVNRSAGSRLWDVDGNEYVDALNGFGSNLLGYQPEVITTALKQQIDKGYELGPQHELAGEVCKLIVEFTGQDRAALCNTGSEAVLGAMRIARTVTGRSLIVAFSGSYHGIVDEVIVRGTKKLKTFPAAPGIMPEAVQNMIILDYGTPESLEIIRQRADELAAVLVEPVQSRRPEFQPIEFLKEVRKITAAAGTALIFDEVITGFRMHPAGTQGLFGIRADLGTYGKVIAGGLPIGVIAGSKLYMDALDGGSWRYGDQSGPESGVTYFAGTFVRHPLALASTKSTLEYLKAKGPALQHEMTDKTKRLADKLNEICTKNAVPAYIAQFGSLWKIKFKEELPYLELLFTLLREKGVHIWDGFPCFLTAAHTDKEVDFIVSKFEQSVDELIAAGFLPSANRDEKTKAKYKSEDLPPVQGARLGKDKDGNPAWFIADPGRPGKYLQVN